MEPSILVVQDGYGQQKRPNYSLLETLSFSWLNPTFTKASQKALEKEDLEEIPLNLKLGNIQEIESRILKSGRVFSIVVFSVVSPSPPSANAAVLFSTLAWFSQLRGPLFWLPQALTFKADSDVGMDRIKGGLKDKTRILVTHQLTVLPHVDFIVVMKEGRVVEQGTFKELMARKNEFARFLATQHLEHDWDTRDHEDVKVELEEDEGVELERIRRMLEEKGKNARVLMQVEDRAIGSVEGRIWVSYLISSGFWLLSACISTIVFQFIRVANDYWLVFWLQDSFHLSLQTYQLSYIGLAFAQTFAVWFLSFCFAKGSVSGAKKLHEKALDKVLKAPLSFFETTPVGRILNRFSKDQDGVDNAVLDSLRRFIINATNALSVFSVLMINTPLFGAPLLLILAFYYHVQLHYRKTSRELKRLDSVSRSPLYAQIGESLNGLSTIRAFQASDRFVRDNAVLVGRNHLPYYTLMSATQWLSLRLEFASGWSCSLQHCLGCYQGKIQITQLPN